MPIVFPTQRAPGCHCPVSQAYWLLQEPCRHSWTGIWTQLLDVQTVSVFFTAEQSRVCVCDCVYVCVWEGGLCVCVRMHAFVCVCVHSWFCLHVYVSCLVSMFMVLLWQGGLCSQVSVVWRPVWRGHQAGTDGHPDSTPRLLLPAGSQPCYLPQTALLWPLCGGSCMLITNVSDVKCFRVHELWMILWKSTGKPQCIAVVMW